MWIGFRFPVRRVLEMIGVIGLFSFIAGWLKGKEKE